MVLGFVIKWPDRKRRWFWLKTAVLLIILTFTDLVGIFDLLIANRDWFGL